MGLNGAVLLFTLHYICALYLALLAQGSGVWVLCAGMWCFTVNKWVLKVPTRRHFQDQKNGDAIRHAGCVGAVTSEQVPH